MTRLKEGSTVDLLEADDPHVRILRFKNVGTSLESEGKTRGELNARISTMVFRYLEKQGVAHHYLDTVNTHEMRVRRVDVLPLELQVRNIAAASLARRLGLAEGTRFQDPVFEFYYQSPALGFPLFNEDHIRVMEAATRKEVNEMRRLAGLCQEALVSFWRKADLELVDFRLTFGLSVDGAMLVAGKMTPDTHTLWPISTDSERSGMVQRDFGVGKDPYVEIYERLQNAWPELDRVELIPWKP